MWHLRNSPEGSGNPQDEEPAVGKATGSRQAATSMDLSGTHSGRHSWGLL